MRYIMHFFAALLLLCCSAALSYAAPANVWETGGTLCYNAAGGVIGCAGTGQDGELLKGVSWPNPRFTDNTNGTVTDGLTGLVWLKNANCTETAGGVAKSNGHLTWANALTWANSLATGLCGLSDGSVAGDWRLPSQVELLSLVDFSRYNPALTPGNFLNAQSSNYWSSSTFAGSTSNAWVISMGYGYVYYYSKSNSEYVWPVRGGQSGMGK